MIKFDPNDPGLVKAFALAIEKACEKLDFALHCLDWFSLSPTHADFYREKRKSDRSLNAL